MNTDNTELETSQEVNTAQQHKKQFDWLKEYQWQKGQSGNPLGKKPGKTMKEFSRDFLNGMSEEARIEFLKSIDADKVWEMAEGKAQSNTDITSGGKPIPLFDNVTKNVPNNDSNKQDTSTQE